MSAKTTFGILTLVILIACCTVACKKNMPRRGLYWGEFYTQDSAGAAITKYDHSIQIDEVSESSVSINGAKLEKNGNSIKGPMGYTPAFPASVAITLDGKWKNKNGYYTITGNFSAVGNLVNYFGTFKMGSY